jgi:hypothetical protein
VKKSGSLRDALETGSSTFPACRDSGLLRIPSLGMTGGVFFLDLVVCWVDNRGVDSGVLLCC